MNFTLLILRLLYGSERMVLPVPTIPILSKAACAVVNSLLLLLIATATF